jgi:hypothetical protein
MTSFDAEQPVPSAPGVDDAHPAGTVRRSTAAALGATLGAWNRLTPGRAARRWRDMAVGAAFEAEEKAAGLLTDLRRVAATRERWAAELAERGALERARGRRQAVVAVEGAARVLATSPLVDIVVDAQIERVLRPVVLAVLGDVLALLEQEPERIQALIRGQRESMVDELVARIRTGAASGDIAVDRLTTRVFHRGRRGVPRPATDEL